MYFIPLRLPQLTLFFVVFLETDSCNHDIFDCYPSSNCTVSCIGHNSCNNLTIKSYQNFVNLECDGINSCKRIRFTYHIPTPGDDKKYLLPFIEIPNPLNLTLSSNNIEIGEFYILAKRVSTADILDDIKLSRMRCFHFSENGDEERQFGEQDMKYKDGKGHNVLFCDDCILHSVYKFYKHLLWVMLEYKRQQIVNQMGDKLIYNANATRITLDKIGYHYRWDQHIYNYNMLEPRVIEYIIYNEMGNINWHYDEDSEITMVIMISNHQMYDGGDTQMRYNDDKSLIEQFGLKWGDVVIFDSYTFHQILPVLKGNRHVMVIEFWNFGRSFRNGRVSIDHHLMDRKCVDDDGGWDCWYQDRFGDDEEEEEEEEEE